MHEYQYDHRSQISIIAHAASLAIKLTVVARCAMFFMVQLAAKMSGVNYVYLLLHDEVWHFVGIG